MFAERIRENPYYEGIRKMLTLAGLRKVNNFPLVGPLGEKFSPKTFFAVSPSLRGMELVTFDLIGGNYTLPSYLSVLGLKLPERVIAMDVGDEPGRRQALEEALSPSFVPSVLLAMGLTKEDELAVTLLAIPGISPQTALGEVQGAVELALAKIALRN